MKQTALDGGDPVERPEFWCHRDDCVHHRHPAECAKRTHGARGGKECAYFMPSGGRLGIRIEELLKKVQREGHAYIGQERV